MAPRIHTDVQVMFFDTDCGGVVSNIAYLRFIEIARTHLAEKLGLELVEMAQKQSISHEIVCADLRKIYPIVLPKTSI